MARSLYVKAEQAENILQDLARRNLGAVQTEGKGPPSSVISAHATVHDVMMSNPALGLLPGGADTPPPVSSQ